MRYVVIDSCSAVASEIGDFLRTRDVDWIIIDAFNRHGKPNTMPDNYHLITYYDSPSMGQLQLFLDAGRNGERLHTVMGDPTTSAYIQSRYLARYILPITPHTLDTQADTIIDTIDAQHIL